MEKKIIRTQSEFDELDRTKIIDFNLEIEMAGLAFEGNLYTRGYIISGGYISSGGDISSGGYIISRGDIRSGGYIISRGYIRSGGYISSRGDIRSDGDIRIRGVKYRTIGSFTGIYKYIAQPMIAADGTEHIRLGCHFRSVQDWAADFWNNLSEFPNNGDMPSKLRWLAYQTCLQWLEINRESI